MRISSTIFRGAQVAALLSFSSLWCQNSAPIRKPINRNTLVARYTAPPAIGASSTIGEASAAKPADSASSSTAPASAIAAPGVADMATPVGAHYSRSMSVFDGLSRGISPLITSVEVRADSSELADSDPQPFEAGSLDIVSTAGTFGDVSRYIQTLPGVVATSDLSNEVLVRGGHPMENLFLVDGIEVPNINHLATMGTTGGFGPMIDSGVIQGVKVYTGGFDASYPERLSSVTEIRTLSPEFLTSHVEADLGLQGFGGLAEKAVHGGDLLVSAHHGLLEMMNSVGLGGLPSYSNELARYRHTDSSGNRLTILHLAGWDSVEVSPCEADPEETSTIDSQYSGWRETTGAEWQQVYSGHSFGVASVSDSEQVEHIHQQEQLVTPTDLIKYYTCPVPLSVLKPTPVYMEDSNDGFDTANYRYEFSSSRISVSAGSSFWLDRPDFQIDQPIGAFSPYSVSPARVDSTSFSSNFSTGETGSYAELTAHPLRGLTFSAGARLQTFAFGGHQTLTPRASVRYSLGERVSFNAAFAGYAQMPPFAYLLAYPGNRNMSPMRDRHEILGMDLNLIKSSQIHIEAYNKPYRDIPASTEYPAVTLHDMVDMLGHQFVWLPMDSGAAETRRALKFPI
jgi:hypothetical protein